MKYNVHENGKTMETSDKISAKRELNGIFRQMHSWLPVPERASLIQSNPLVPSKPLTIH